MISFFACFLSPGPLFDIREFHHQILKVGYVPLDVLEEVVDDWVHSVLHPSTQQMMADDYDASGVTSQYGKLRSGAKPSSRKLQRSLMILHLSAFLLLVVSLSRFNRQEQLFSQVLVAGLACVSLCWL